VSVPYRVSQCLVLAVNVYTTAVYRSCVRSYNSEMFDFVLLSFEQRPFKATALENVQLKGCG
jgi:hypothetical protein